jgi:hypothetical protein
MCVIPLLWQLERSAAGSQHSLRAVGNRGKVIWRREQMLILLLEGIYPIERILPPAAASGGTRATTQ